MKPSFLSTRSLHLEDLFAAYREQAALISRAGTRTFGDVLERVRGVVFHLERAGVRPRDRVALHGENGDLHLNLFLASWVMGFLYIPLDFKAPLGSLPENDAVDFLVTAGEVPPSLKASVLRPADLRKLPPAGAKDRPWPAAPLKREASVIFTSGSTGKPRGLVHTVGNYVYSALGTNEFIGLEPSDRWLISLPLFHVGGVLIWVRTLLAGAACILPETVKAVEPAVRTYRPSVVSLVPAQLIRFLESAETVCALREAKIILLGGAPSPAWLIEKALDLGLPIMPTYGATESCAQVTGVRRGAARHAYFTAGQPLPYRELRVTADGTIRLGGRTLFSRSLEDSRDGNPRENRFFTTADTGYIDPEGNLVVLGRRDGAFISGGENIHPFEIENHLLALAGIETAIVAPAPHREFGMVPWAFVEITGSFDEAVIIADLKTRLPTYKVPKKIIRLDPRGKGGKLKYSRKELASLAAAMAERERDK